MIIVKSWDTSQYKMCNLDVNTDRITQNQTAAYQMDSVQH